MTHGATPRLIVTDLDGTLLDHHSYSVDAARPALAQCQALGVPVIFNTSKTRAETEALAKQLGLSHPFIVENGSAVLIPKDYFLSGQPAQAHCLGEERSRLLRWLARVRKEEQLSFEGFADWSLAQIIEHTGLSEAQAEAASQREYSEPFLWQDTEHKFLHLQKQANKKGFRLLKGGRFFHLLGKTDKGQAMRWLAEQYQQAWGNTPQLIALGDGHNDIDMLEAADVAVLVRSPAHEFPELSGHNTIIKTDATGPQGWADAVLELLQAET
ncbi:HAD-IIB family hydrolase [Ferrimonas marina]|uniref:Mannosyl-3-phosphoglycerate phosphatase n=1 Tax=Ferrimonas marina TaxID=299255 RepID=A0A1M5YGL5_9GAMM|nr:HAD-IIB family hydrolase [Ferrimonas marina]SHI11211.1 mannosyl-3-phosphoglycerate phosphatase [Ferrimonas marina]